MYIQRRVGGCQTSRSCTLLPAARQLPLYITVLHPLTVRQHCYTYRQWSVGYPEMVDIFLISCWLLLSLSRDWVFTAVSSSRFHLVSHCELLDLSFYALLIESQILVGTPLGIPLFEVQHYFHYYCTPDHRYYLPKDQQADGITTIVRTAESCGDSIGMMLLVVYQPSGTQFQPPRHSPLFHISMPLHFN